MGAYPIASRTVVTRIITDVDLASGGTVTSKRFHTLGAKFVYFRMRADTSSATTIDIAPRYYVFTDTTGQTNPADLTLVELKMAGVTAEVITTGHVGVVFPDMVATTAYNFATGAIFPTDDMDIIVTSTGDVTAGLTVDALVVFV